MKIKNKNKINMSTSYYNGGYEIATNRINFLNHYAWK